MGRVSTGAVVAAVCRWVNALWWVGVHEKGVSFFRRE